MIFVECAEHRVRAQRLNIMRVRTAERGTEHQTNNAVNVAVRNNRKIAVVFGEFLHVERHARGINQVVVRVHNAGGTAGCAGGKNDCGDGFVRVGRGGQIGRNARAVTFQNAAIQNIKHREAVIGHGFEFFFGFRRKERRTHIGLADKSVELLCGQGSVNKRRGTAQLADGEKGNRPLGAALRHKRDTVARAHAGVGQMPRISFRQLKHLTVSIHSPRAVVHRNRQSTLPGVLGVLLIN